MIAEEDRKAVEKDMIKATRRVTTGTDLVEKTA